VQHNTGEITRSQILVSVPAPLNEVPWSGPETLVLWDNQNPTTRTQVDGIEQIEVRLKPQDLRSFRPGQTLVLPLPDGGPEVQALITDTFNDVNGTYNWKAVVQNGLPNASVLITQGQQQTHIAIFTEQGSYTLVADNVSGRATLVDEGKLIARQAMVDDGVVLQEHHELTPPLTP